jgi:hypothetical protein
MIGAIDNQRPSVKRDEHRTKSIIVGGPPPGKKIIIVK